MVFPAGGFSRLRGGKMRGAARDVVFVLPDALLAKGRAKLWLVSGEGK
jgi:hypothetical protein